MTCTRCDRPTADAIYLCHEDATRLEEVLDLIPDALTEADVTATKRDKTGSGKGARRGGSSSMPFNEHASDKARDLSEKAASWAFLVMESDRDAERLRNVEPSRYLRMSISLIRGQDYAGDLMAELDDALHKTMRAVDLPPDRVDLGRCGVEGCTGRISGQMIRKDGRPVIASRAKCRGCDSPYDGRVVYAARIADTWEYWCPLSDAVRLALTIPDMPSRATLYRWAEAGRFAVKHHNGTDMYCPAQINAVVDNAHERVA